MTENATTRYYVGDLIGCHGGTHGGHQGIVTKLSRMYVFYTSADGKKRQSSYKFVHLVRRATDNDNNNPPVASSTTTTVPTPTFIRTQPRVTQPVNPQNLFDAQLENQIKVLADLLMEKLAMTTDEVRERTIRRMRARLVLQEEAE